jgi:hypothetical protein
MTKKMFVLVQRGCEDHFILGVFDTLSAASAVALEYTNAEEDFDDCDGPCAKYSGDFVVKEFDLNVAAKPVDVCF